MDSSPISVVVVGWGEKVNGAWLIREDLPLCPRHSPGCPATVLLCKREPGVGLGNPSDEGPLDTKKWPGPSSRKPFS